MANVNDPNVTIYRSENGKLRAGISKDSEFALSTLDREQVDAFLAYMEASATELELELGRTIGGNNIDDNAIAIKARSISSMVSGLRSARKGFLELISKLRQDKAIGEQ